jgi:excinuclease ABC subunit B
VSLVAILDADKEGFLRSETSLIQTIGRAARNVNAKVILYADKVTEAMRSAMDETRRRRALQEKYNEEHGITPETVKKHIRAGIEQAVAAHRQANAAVGRNDDAEMITEEYLSDLEAEMYKAAEDLDFERAAALRDRIGQLRDSVGQPVDEVSLKSYKAGPKRGRGGKGRVPRPKRQA